VKTHILTKREKGEKERRMHGKKGKKIQNSKNTRVSKKNREKRCHLGDFFTSKEQEKKTHSSLRAHTITQQCHL